MKNEHKTVQCENCHSSIHTRQTVFYYKKNDLEGNDGYFCQNCYKPEWKRITDYIECFLYKHCLNQDNDKCKIERDEKGEPKRWILPEIYTRKLEKGILDKDPSKKGYW